VAKCGGLNGCYGLKPGCLKKYRQAVMLPAALYTTRDTSYLVNNSRICRYFLVKIKTFKSGEFYKCTAGMMASEKQERRKGS
jgi:hypothetical protein